MSDSEDCDLLDCLTEEMEKVKAFALVYKIDKECRSRMEERLKEALYDFDCYYNGVRDHYDDDSYTHRAADEIEMEMYENVNVKWVINTIPSLSAWKR
jgi:hypothetical protein